MTTSMKFVPPERRLLTDITGHGRRLKELEHRADNSPPAVTGTVDPAYTSGDPQVTITGQMALSGPYQHLTSYTPAAGDTVLLIPLNGSLVVAGKLA